MSPLPLRGGQEPQYWLMYLVFEDQRMEGKTQQHSNWAVCFPDILVFFIVPISQLFSRSYSLSQVHML